MKLKLFNYDVIIQKRDVFHITDFGERPEAAPYAHDFNIDKRINAMVKEHGFIEYIFRDFDMALLTYGESAIQLLQDVMMSLTKIRTQLVSRGAEHRIELFDQKVHEQFHKLLRVLEQRRDFEILKKVKDYDIKEYHNGELLS